MPTAKKPKGDTNEVATISTKCRAVSLATISPSADTETAFAVLNELKSSPMCDAENTSFSGNISSVEPPGTFTFPITITLKRPLKL